MFEGSDDGTLPPMRNWTSDMNVDEGIPHRTAKVSE
jgi:hypothetical protein